MRRNISVSLDKQTLESIEENRQLTTVSRFIEACVLDYLDKSEGKNPSAKVSKSSKIKGAS